MFPMTELDIAVNKNERETSLDCFVNWVFSGAKLDVGKRIIPSSNCQNDMEIKEHINRCESGMRVKVLH
ncbi:hypothetical protein [Bacillus altitudinis]|uniref:Uncharacterized protein n=1 Tax=Bacillus altitudinis TaxID=293387 RepID=A0ABV1SAA1_BACAB|nr:hypothetical protein [Bacillus altitudinis]NOL32985.1 hypothetical protein [Bacillus altitudinis]